MPTYIKQNLLKYEVLLRKTFDLLIFQNFMHNSEDQGNVWYLVWLNFNLGLFFIYFHYMKWIYENSMSCFLRNLFITAFVGQEGAIEDTYCIYENILSWGGAGFCSCCGVFPFFLGNWLIIIWTGVFVVLVLVVFCPYLSQVLYN